MLDNLTYETRRLQASYTTEQIEAMREHLARMVVRAYGNMRYDALGMPDEYGAYLDWRLPFRRIYPDVEPDVLVGDLDHFINELTRPL